MSHKKYRTETNCLNCGTEVTGKFCSQCGQENIETRENFFHLAFHTIGDFFHFDSKFFRSLIPLITKPGFLTQEYWAGKRVDYIHPLRLFFFITIVMVIIANAYYHKFEAQIATENITITEDSTNVKTQEEKEDIERRKQKLKDGVRKSFNEVAVYLKYISFLLLPIYAIVFKILYRRAKRFYVDHLVLMLHIQSFTYLVASIALLISILFFDSEHRDWWPIVLILGTGMYTFLAFRRIFGQSRIKTALKLILALGYMLTITIIFLTVMILANVL